MQMGDFISSDLISLVSGNAKLALLAE